MSVARATEWMNRVRAAGITVHEQAGWQTRGNGQASAYEGWINHHTATPFANANLDILINGRSDLSGPLCNSCGWADGSVGLIAANPANHAGASGGWDTSPLPVTSLFNKRVWGHEIIYPGTVPMTPEQYRTALIVSKIGVDVWGYGDVNRIKFHQGTSITGKWDPGFANGQTYSINQFRNDIRDLGTPSEEIMTSVQPASLPYSNTWAYEMFPFEVDSNSSLIKLGWFSIAAGWGSSADYEVIFVGPNGTLVSATGGNGFPQSGNLKDRQRAVWSLPAGCEGVALRYKNNDNNRLGYCFPQRTK